MHLGDVRGGFRSTSRSTRRCFRMNAMPGQWARRRLTTLLFSLLTFDVGCGAASDASSTSNDPLPSDELAASTARISQYPQMPQVTSNAAPQGMQRQLGASQEALKAVQVPTVGNCNTTFALYGAIDNKFLSLGGCSSFLGLPASSEKGTPDGVGRFNHFINRTSGNIFSPPGSGPSNGSIYWTPLYGAWSVHGAIRDKWASLGWEGNLGYPVTDEAETPDGTGRFNHFNHPSKGSAFVPPGSARPSNSSVYWTPWTGPHEVHGAIRTAWANNGWEGRLGYPVSDEYDCQGGGRCSDFEVATIWWISDHAELLLNLDCPKLCPLGVEARSAICPRITDPIGHSQCDARRFVFESSCSTHCIDVVTKLESNAHPPF
jgi:hypothetical protein